MTAGSEIPLLSLENAGARPGYVSLLEESIRRGECLLDPPVYFRNTPPEDVLARHGGWILGKTKFPYSNTEQDRADVIGHMMLFPERHILSPDEMTENEQLIFWKMCKTARDDFGAATGAIAMRYSSEGRQAVVGSTISHIHAHIVVPHLDPQTGRVPDFGTPEERVVAIRIG
jgi:diadenosine tetraphosphate (Ap4A) HIT family hydrolase